MYVGYLFFWTLGGAVDTFTHFHPKLNSIKGC